MESISWETIVERLFLNQRYLPFVFCLQKLKAQRSWYWLITKAVILARIIRREFEKNTIISLTMRIQRGRREARTYKDEKYGNEE